jgi:capsular polysaccharide biosynthesis protein
MSLTSVALTAQRLATWLVNRRLVSPRTVGYRHLANVDVPTYCRQTGTEFQEHATAKTVSCPLPVNISSRDALERNRGRYERSFHDVPEYRVEPSSSATIHNCRILRTRDQWGDDFYAIVTSDDRLLQSAGTQYRPEHAALLRGGRVSRSIDRVTWTTTHSTRNHYMWLYTHLPRVLLAEQLGLKDQILFPAQDLLSPVKRSTLDLLGYQSPSFVEAADEVIQVNELTVIETDGFDPVRLNELRQRLVGNQDVTPRSRLYISREKCHYRKLLNESEIWPELERQGFEKVFLEDLSLQEQIRKLHSAEIVLGVHGAGFANILFCRPGTLVIEIQDPEDPNPHFYALASLLGLTYNVLVGDVDPQAEPHFRDLFYPVSQMVSLCNNS